MKITVIGNITIAAEDLREIVMLKRLSYAMMNRIQSNYKAIVGINAVLIALGAVSYTHLPVNGDRSGKHMIQKQKQRSEKEKSNINRKWAHLL